MSSSACTSTTVSVSDSSEFTSTCTSGGDGFGDAARTRGGARRRVRRGRSRPRARVRSSRVTRAPPSSATRPKGSAPRNTSSARPSVVPNRLASSTSSPHTVERAGERHQQTGPVAGHDRHRRRCPRRRARNGPSANRASSASCMHHRLDVERQHVLLGQARRGTCRRGRAPRRSCSASRRSAATALASPRSIAVAAFTKRSRTSAAFDGLHAAGPVAARVADRQQVEEAEPFGIARARGGDVVGHRRVGEVAARSRPRP